MMSRLLLAFAACGATSCALVGNVKPVDLKSDSYGVMDLAKDNPDWAKLDASARGADGKDPEATTTEVSDVAYQSKKDASIISLNSACREAVEKENKGLKELTTLLLLGISDVSMREEKQSELQGSAALETTVMGKLNAEDVMIRTVVLRRKACVYDLMYVTRPHHFNSNEDAFSHFIASLRLK